jgi:hypothetical protein
VRDVSTTILAGKLTGHVAEHSFERGLEKMRSEWSEVAFDLMPYKDSGTYVLRGLDDISAMLDDHILKAQVMLIIGGGSGSDCIDLCPVLQQVFIVTDPHNNFIT